MNKTKTVLQMILLGLSVATIILLAYVMIVLSELSLSYTSDLGLTAATLLLAIIAFLSLVSAPALGNAITETNKTIIQPFIIVRGSYKIDRETCARSGKSQITK
ncbi:MAG: hypothetical protein WED05_00500 [Candidatus Atabeyarchaeum deiterrae]